MLSKAQRQQQILRLRMPIDSTGSGGASMSSLMLSPKRHCTGPRASTPFRLAPDSISMTSSGRTAVSRATVADAPARRGGVRGQRQNRCVRLGSPSTEATQATRRCAETDGHLHTAKLLGSLRLMAGPRFNTISWHKTVTSADRQTNQVTGNGGFFQKAITPLVMERSTVQSCLAAPSAQSPLASSLARARRRSLATHFASELCAPITLSQ
jgi:hypothetical protein